MKYSIGVVCNNEIINALVFEGESKDEVLALAQSFVENGAIADDNKLIILDPDAGFGIGDYIVNGKFIRPKFCAVLNDDSYCTSIKKMPLHYVYGDENDDEIPILLYHEHYIGAYYTGDKWDFDDKMQAVTET